MGEKTIAWLSSLSKSDENLAGQKASSLGEIYNQKFPVPQAFAVTSQAFIQFLDQTKLTQKIQDTLQSKSSPQEKSQKIQNLITTSIFPPRLSQEILEAYDHFNVDLGEIKDSPGALAILKSAREPIFVTTRTSNEPGKPNTSFINIKGNPELLQKIKECFAYSFQEDQIKNLKKTPKTSVIIQKMINSEKSGTAKSQNKNIKIKSIFGLGKGLSLEEITPDKYLLSQNFEILEEKISDKKFKVTRTASGQSKTVSLEPEESTKRTLKTHELKQLAEYALKLEEYFQSPQEIQFAIENNITYILQTKPATKEPLPQEEILPIIPTKTQIKIAIEGPEELAQAKEIHAQEIGPIRLEKIILSKGKHPLFYEKNSTLGEYKTLLKENLIKITSLLPETPMQILLPSFEEEDLSNLAGSPKNHSEETKIKFSLSHPEIFKTELRAIKEASKENKPEIILPQVSSVKEITKTYEILKKLKMEDFALGITVETPSIPILIKDICATKISSISFNTKTLAKLTLATNNPTLEDEISWAVLKQISRTLRECKSQGVKTSIHGESVKNPEMLKFLIKQKIDSISTKPSEANKISNLIQRLETNFQIEPINNKEEIKRELEELKQAEAKPTVNNQQPTATNPEESTESFETIEQAKEDSEESKKEDIFS